MKGHDGFFLRVAQFGRHKRWQDRGQANVRLRYVRPTVAADAVFSDAVHRIDRFEPHGRQCGTYACLAELLQRARRLAIGGYHRGVCGTRGQFHGTNERIELTGASSRQVVHVGDLVGAGNIVRDVRVGSLGSRRGRTGQLGVI